MKKSKMKDRFRRGIAAALAVVFGFSGLSASSVLADDATYDVNPPVIESVEFIPSADPLTTNDSVTIRVKTYDAESAVRDVSASVMYADESGTLSMSTEGYSLYSTGEENTYEATVQLLKQRKGGTVCLTGVSAVDTNGNKASADEFIYNDVSNKITALSSFKNKLSFTVGEPGATDIKVSSIGLYKDSSCSESVEGQTLEENSWFHINMVVTDDTGVDSFYARFDGEAGTVINDVTFFKSYDSYDGVAYVSSYNLNGLDEETFHLTHIFAKMTDGSVVDVTPVDGLSYSSKWVKIQSSSTPAPSEERPDYESISLKVNGEEIQPEQRVYPGTAVDVEVVIKDGKAYEDTITAEFMVALKDNSSMREVDLTRASSDSNVYTGQFEVTEDTYPTVWQLRGIKWASSHTIRYDIGGYYFTVQHGEGGTLVLPTFDLSFSLRYLEENDGAISVSYYKSLELKDILMFSTITADQLDLSDVPTSVGGANIIGWHVYQYTWDGTTTVKTDLGALEDYKVTSNQHLYLAPVYDKKLVTVHYQYMKDGAFCTDNVEYAYGQDEAITDDTINSYLVKEGQDEAGVPFEKWQTSDTAEQINTQLIDGHADVYVNACYTGKEMVVVTYDRGTLDYDGYEEASLVDTGLTDEQLAEQFKTPKKNPYEGIDLNGAVKLNTWNNEWVERYDNIDRILYTADFTNCVAQLIVSSDSKTESYYMGFDEGASFTIPTEMGNFKDIKWEQKGSWTGSGKDTYEDIDGSETYTAVKLMMFYGKGTYVKPVSGDTTDGSSSDGASSGDTTTTTTTTGTTTASSSGTGSTEYVPVKMTTEKIASEVNAITEAVKAGNKTITISMDGATVVPTAILEAAKGKDIDVVLDMGTYAWTINGKDIKSASLKDVDLKVNFDTNAVPENLISSLAGSNPTKQISLAYNGDFGFTASLSFNIGSQYQGKYGNLYYYDSNGKLVFMNAGKITEDGTVSLKFSHASDYVVVINEKSMAASAPITGDNTAIFGWIALILAGAAILLIAYRKKAAR